MTVIVATNAVTQFSRGHFQTNAGKPSYFGLAYSPQRSAGSRGRRNASMAPAGGRCIEPNQQMARPTQVPYPRTLNVFALATVMAAVAIVVAIWTALDLWVLS
jgi:hypothetical protein